MKNYYCHSILMLCCVLSFCTLGDVVRTKEITEIEIPPNFSFSFPCETKIEDRKIKSKGESCLAERRLSFWALQHKTEKRKNNADQHSFGPADRAAVPDPDHGLRRGQSRAAEGK